MCISVDLPELDGPITAANCPRGTSRVTPRSACTADSPFPYCRVRPAPETAGVRSTTTAGSTSVTTAMVWLLPLGGSAEPDLTLCAPTANAQVPETLRVV